MFCLCAHRSFVSPLAGGLLSHLALGGCTASPRVQNGNSSRGLSRTKWGTSLPFLGNYLSPLPRRHFSTRSHESDGRCFLAAATPTRPLAVPASTCAERRPPDSSATILGQQLLLTAHCFRTCPVREGGTMRASDRAAKATPVRVAGDQSSKAMGDDGGGHSGFGQGRGGSELR